MSDAGYFVFMVINGVLMATGFTAIIVLASELVNRNTFGGGDNDDR